MWAVSRGLGPCLFSVGKARLSALQYAEASDTLSRGLRPENEYGLDYGRDMGIMATSTLPG